MHKAFLKRIKLISIVITVVFIGIAARISALQIVDYGVYKERAMRQQKIPDAGGVARGEIFMQKQGQRVSIVSTQDGWLLAVNPKKVVNAEELYQKLQGVGALTLSQDEFTRRATKENDPHEVIEHRVTTKLRREIELLKLP